MSARPAVSVVIPAHNEEPSLLPLVDRLVETLAGLGRSFEVVIVDDASTDGSVRLLRNLCANESRLKAVCLRRNSGQTAALAAGFEAASGEVVVAMDGDLQHAPEDIPALLAKVDEGYDLVNGWREDRNDGLLTRRLPSRVANWLIRKLSGVELRDFGGTFKAYRADLLDHVRLYGELHRFVPVLAAMHGARIAEVPISIRERAAGRSHYGLGRTLRVFFDLLTVVFLAPLPDPSDASVRLARNRVAAARARPRWHSCFSRSCKGRTSWSSTARCSSPPPSWPSPDCSSSAPDWSERS